MVTSTAEQLCWQKVNHNSNNALILKNIFSLLDIPASKILNVIGSKKKKSIKNISIFLERFIFVICMSLVVWQVYVCVPKIILRQTGTTESFGNLKINLSLTLCSSNIEERATIKMPKSIKDKTSENNWTTLYQWGNRKCSKAETDRMHTTYISVNKENHILSCVSYVVGGNELVIDHRYHFFQRTPTQLFLHETGLFHSPFKVRIVDENFEINTKLILNIKRIIQIPKEGSCAVTKLYDDNINENLKKKLVKRYGCVLAKLRYLICWHISC